MKRLINAYRIELKRLLAEGRRAGSAAVTPEQLALWTIVSLRWPLLADELALRPGLLSSDSSSSNNNNNNNSNTDMRADLRQLWGSEDVQAVIRGDGVSARLTGHAVSVLAGLSLPGSGHTSHEIEDERS